MTERPLRSADRSSRRRAGTPGVSSGGTDLVRRLWSFQTKEKAKPSPLCCRRRHQSAPASSEVSRESSPTTGGPRLLVCVFKKHLKRSLIGFTARIKDRNTIVHRSAHAEGLPNTRPERKEETNLSHSRRRPPPLSTPRPVRLTSTRRENPHA